MTDIGIAVLVGGHNRPCSLLEEAVGAHSIISWNDETGRTQAEVLAAFDKAIELAEAQS